VRAGARNARGRRSLFGVEQLRPAAASRGALVGGGGVEERAVPSRFFNCRACVTVYRSTSRPHGPPYREALLAGGALRLRPDRIRGCPAAVPPAPAAAAVCLYLPPPQDTFGRRSVTPHLHARKGSTGIRSAATPRYPPSLVPSRARTRTRTIANPSIYTPRLLLLMLPPAHSVVTYSHVAPIARAGSSQQGNKDGMEGEETAGNDMGRQLCKAATTQDGDQTTTADEPNKGPRYVPSAGRAAERRAPLSALRLSHADRSQFFTEVATV
jgi:hypothetical protein